MVNAPGFLLNFFFNQETRNWYRYLLNLLISFPTFGVQSLESLAGSPKINFRVQTINFQKAYFSSLDENLQNVNKRLNEHVSKKN